MCIFLPSCIHLSAHEGSIFHENFASMHPFETEGGLFLLRYRALRVLEIALGILILRAGIH
jgi:hypothetical protein